MDAAFEVEGARWLEHDGGVEGEVVGVEGVAHFVGLIFRIS